MELFDEELRLSTGAGAGGAGVELGSFRGLPMDGDRLRVSMAKRGGEPSKGFPARRRVKTDLVDTLSFDRLVLLG